MSRTNPHKKKRRLAKRTLLIHGEGEEDCVFLKHLRSLYSQNSNSTCKINRGKGGSADSIVLQAIRSPGAYDKRIVILDNDKAKNEMAKARRLAKEKNIELIEHTPCIEAILLSILTTKNSFKQKNSSEYKKEFESKYINSKKRSKITEYQKLFSKKMLDRKRLKIKELGLLISLFENK